MRNIYYILMALLIICGCDKSSLSTNDTEYTNQYIFFDASVETTKGTLVTGTALPSAAGTSFGVFAYRGAQNTPVFDMYSNNNNIAKLYRPEDNKPFKYDQLALWTAGEPHSFYAYYPYNATSTITGIGQNNGTAFITYSQPSNLDEMVDVMTASVRNTTSDKHTTSPVSFTFNHRLFAIGLTVVNAQTESKSDVAITSANIEFVGVNTSAEFNMDADDTYNIALSTGNITHTYTPTTIRGPQNNSSVSYNFNDGNEFLLIPCRSLQVNINLKIKNVWKNENGEEIYVEEIPYTLNKTITPTGGFVAGKKYQLTVTKTDKGVEFVCELSSGWTSVDVPTDFE